MSDSSSAPFPRSQVRVYDAQSRVRSFQFSQPHIHIGRDDECDVVLKDPAVSGRHCTIVCDGNSHSVRDHGSTNGTFVEHRRIREPTSLAPGQSFHVGPFRVEVRPGASEQSRPAPVATHAVAPSPAGRGPGLLGAPSEEQRWLERHARLARFARGWDDAGRPARLLLKGRELERSLDWLADGEAHPERSAVLTTVQRELVRTSEARRVRNRKLRWLAPLTAGLTLTGVGFGIVSLTRDSVPDASPTEPEAGHREIEEEWGAHPDPAPVSAERKWIKHRVIPAETLEDIAIRYGVSREQVCMWNGLDCDHPDIQLDQRLQIRPKRRPLPQQFIRYELEAHDSYQTISERFGVPINKLWAYNPEIGKKLDGVDELTIWIDPKPLTRTDGSIVIPELDVRQDAVSVGKPAEGTLVNGIQFPKSDMYKRRAAYKMYGSSHLVSNLYTALARFRTKYGFDGALVLADISRDGGGLFPPHKSHQAGRDIDIWLPTLKGVYKKSHLGADRRPNPDEANWFATWHLIESLIDTGEIEYIFLTYDLQQKVFQAAITSGKTPDELAPLIQWPNGRSRAILRHSDGHIHHIHVRFRCGPRDAECIGPRSQATKAAKQ